MAENTQEAAQRAYRTLCDLLTKRQYTYQADDAQRIVRFHFNVKPMPMPFAFYVDEKRQLLRLLSFIPFAMSESKRMEAAAAVCLANYHLVDGSFDYDATTGRCLFRMATSYGDGQFGEGLVDYMLENAYHAVETYNIQFFGLEQGRLILEQMLENNNP